MKKFYLNSEKTSCFFDFILFTSGKLRVAMVLFVFLFASNTEVTAQIAQRGSATTASAATTNNTTITINKPSGVVAGDVLLFSVVQNETDNDNGGLASPTLSGWTLVKDILIRSDGTSNGNNAWFGSIYYRVSDGSEDASFSFAMHSRCDMAIGSMVAFTGVACNALMPDGTSGGPFDIAPGDFNNANSTTATATEVTVDNDNAALIMFAMCSNDKNYINWSNSQTELFDNITANGDDASVGAAWLSSVNSGPTGSGTVTLSSSERNSAIFLVLRRATTLSVSAASATRTLCQNTALTNITHTTSGATGIGTATGLPAGVTAAWASNTITISGTPTASGTFSYSIPLTGGCGSINATGIITVSPASVGGTVTGGSTICSGSTSAELTLSGHTGTITKWQSSVSPFTTWTDIVNTSSTYTSGTLTATTQFRAVVASGSCSSATSTGTTVTVNALPATPTITAGTTTTFCSGGSVALTSSASSGNQWYKDGAEISGATSRTYSATTSGVYKVITNNGSCSSLASAGTTVTVNALPATPTITAGSTTTFCSGGSVILTSTINTGYQWYKDGAAISGATSRTYSATITGEYTVITSNGTCSSIASAGTTVTVNALPTRPTIAAGSTTTFCSGGGVTLTSSASSGNQWYKDGTAISGATSTTYSATTSGVYTVITNNGICSSLASAGTTVTVNALPATPTITAGSTTTFCSGGSVTLTSTINTGYQWYKDGAAISGATSRTYSATTTGEYTVITSNGTCSSLASAVTTVNVNSSVAGTVSANQTICTGNSASVSLSGYTGSIQWQKSSNGTSIWGNVSGGSGSTAATYITPNLSSTTYYRAVVTSGGCTSATSAVVKVTVNTNAAPDISFQQNTDDNAETIDLCGQIGGGGQNDIDINSGAIAGATYQWEYSTVSATGPWIVDSYTGEQFNIASFSHTPGTYYFRVLRTYGCSVYSDVISLTVNNSGTLPVFAVQGNSSCTDGTVTLTVSSATSGTYNWYDSALGGSLVQANSASFTTPVLNTTTTYYVTFTPDGQTCPSPRVAVTAAIGALPIPTVGTITQPSCAAPTTGSVVLTNLPNGGTLSQNNGTATTEISYAGTTATISGLAVGTYTFTVSNSSCVSSPLNVTITPLVTNTWNGSSWSANTPSDVLHLEQNIVFDGNYNSNNNVYGCTCEVKSGDVVIHENYTMRITNEVKVTGGTLTFLNTASLVQTNDVVNTGAITYNRTTPTVRTTDYIYWSSPVSGQTIANFSPTAGSIKYYYDLGWKVPSNAAEMAKGTGYIIRGQVTSNSKYDASFVGVPNNGSVAIPAAHPATYYLVGNPYPSAVDADEFLYQNAGLDGNIYLWTHNTEIAKNAAGTELVYTSDDYANYNFTGSTGTFKSVECKTCPNNAKPIGKIAAGQSFFVKTIGSTSIQFNNNMRVGSKSDTKEFNSQFFKTTNANATKSKTAVVEKHRLWLNLTNDQGAFKQTLVGYVTGATNDLDARFDGENFNGNAYVNFYSINQNKNFTIQGRALPFDENDTVALGFKSTVKGSFTIAVDEADGLLATQDVFIEDKLKGTTFNLKTGNYTFDTEIGTFDERFVLRYIDKTLATEDFTIAPNKVLVSVKNKQVKINAGETIDKVIVYDLLGKEIFKKSNVNEKELTILNLVSNEQALVVKMTFENGKTVSRKVIY